MARRADRQASADDVLGDFFDNVGEFWPFEGAGPRLNDDELKTPLADKRKKGGETEEKEICVADQKTSPR